MLSAENEQLGLVKFEEALEKARALGLDLVEIASKVDPPVCRIMDYGKYQYQESKRQREARKKQHQHKVKEIKFHPNIDQHDYQTKINHLVAFLEKGDKVKVSMFFRGREMAHAELGMELMQRVLENMKEVATVDAPPRRSGRVISMMLSPAARGKER